jgi:dihydroflavonol-4-reductase
LRFLVTGATGFVGSHIVIKLLENGHDVNVLVRKTSNSRNIQGLPLKVVYGDLRDKDSLKKAAHSCNGLFHAAAMYGFWARNPQDFYDINVEGTKNVIEAAISQGLEKIIYTSSESTLDPGTSTGGNSYKLASVDDVFGDYKKSKLLAEIEVLKLCKKGYPVTIVNPTTPIGGGDVYPTPTGKIVLDMLNGAMPAYVNTGLNIIDVEDVAEGHILAYEKGGCGERYVLGNENLTLKEMLEMIARLANINAPKVQIPLAAARFLGYIDEFLSGKILRKHPKVPLAAVKTAYKFKYYDCAGDTKKLGLDPGPVKLAFEKSIRWFKDNGYVKN